MGALLGGSSTFLSCFLSFRFSADCEAMGFLLQITVSCPCALLRQVAGGGCRRWCWCCELAVHVVEAYPQLVGSRMGDPRGIDWLGSKMGPTTIVDLFA